MKIFSIEQIRLADKLTIERQHITSDALMERAGVAIFNWIKQQLPTKEVKINIFCGIGNNGGDGLVVARHLLEQGYNIEVYVVNFSDKRSKDFLLNFDRIKELKLWPKLLSQDTEIPNISSQDVVIDAIFGIGLNRPADDWVANLINEINTSGAFVLSVDIPSGLYMDKVPSEKDAVIEADFTLTFQLPKLIFLLPETGKYTRYWDILDIGQDPKFLEEEESNMVYVDKKDVLSFYKSRSRFSHKGTYGHALVIGGSHGKVGAVLMSSEAALHAGAGLVTAFVPECGYQTLQTAFPEAMVLTDEEENFVTKIDYDIEPSAIGIGPGMGTHEKTVKAISNFLRKNKKPMVIDADALNIIAENNDLLTYLNGKAILTPHPKELERLIGKWNDDFEKLEMVKSFSKDYNLVMVVKDAYTAVVYGDQLFFNSTGNPGMATGGSGDVLTGIITGLVAQKYSLLQAAILGVYIHGRAGDLAVMRSGVEALTATDIIDFTGDAFLDLHKKNRSDYQENPS
ncbi:NAD(P)H-hydrate dehydratase [Galbibacter mesophilus]|uniref:NAD(P)H-hydrate dehydratase n=1 Tax=Galbibacter mesophilus TaxID=379069 RepID=UPI00191FE124|nr:NAD(P)H-hydrate dehydratase [Galbibacter mesophilus]MCM5663447.1 NAD(P)H-hydrate dehydratase [Galbibacter mesophilus]